MKRTKRRIKGEKAKTTKVIESFLKSQIKDWDKRTENEKERRIREIKKRNALKIAIAIVFTAIATLTIILLINEKQKEGITETETKQTIKETKEEIIKEEYQVNGTLLGDMQTATGFAMNLIILTIGISVVLQVIRIFYDK